jgi:excinuclease ABC subunit A
MSNRISIKGVRQNNLKGFDLDLPLNELIVVTGVSGSGKSSLAFDTVYAEGQRRYVETFSPYARQFLDRMDKPAAERIDGIPPAIAIDQTNPVRTSRSTVGTMTELNDHLKLLFARAASLYCRGCGKPVRRDTPQTIVEELLTRGRDAQALLTFGVTVPKNFSEEEIKGFLAQQGYTRIHRREGTQLEVIQDRVRLSGENRDRLVEDLEAALKHGQGRVSAHTLDSDGKPKQTWRFSSGLHCADCDIAYRDPVPNFFSFNSPIGACETCRGFGRVIGIDYGLVIPDESLTLREGAVKPWRTPTNSQCQDDMVRFAKKRGVPLDTPWRDLAQKHRKWVIEGEGDWGNKHWYGIERFFKWLEGRAYKMHVRVMLSKYRAYTPCPACDGARLKPEALLWRIGAREDAGVGPDRLPGFNIHEMASLSLQRSRDFFRQIHLPKPLDEATDLLVGEIRTRFDYLVQVGLGYLTLDRQSRTLSGGEVQRINLTTALGTSLVNTLFVLDEPSIGLHPRDMGRVVDVLHRLRDAGNTLLVVEHDPQVMLAADRLLDIGPGPGDRGGNIVFFGAPAELKNAPDSLTAQYLNGSKHVAAAAAPKPAPAAHIEVLGAKENNLKNIDVKIPLNRLVCITGVSGSGKSTLIQDVLYNGLLKMRGRAKDAVGEHREIRGSDYVDDVMLVDQSPIGKTTRSNPASYVGAWDAIRKLYAVEPTAIERGYTASTFSFNSGNGRCPTCTGSGFEHVEMQFLSDIYIRCPDCDGKRFRAEVLDVKLVPKGRPQAAAKSIADVLDMTVSAATGFFAGYPEVVRGLEPLMAVGLSYLKLGQPVPTLSGGEAQRLKLAGHLAETIAASSSRKQPQNSLGTLFLFDEPTTGLHFDDIAVLLRAFQRLLAAGHTLVVIEHNLDVMRASDWLIDLGPEGGDAGGEIVCVGTPAQVAKHPTSHTGKALRDYADASLPTAVPRPPAVADTDIRVHHAREHNLKNIDVSIPRERFTVITGVSGSGKSTLAFDILFNEGQRRYLESLNAYARSLVQPATRPDVDALYGLPPTVAIEQRTSRGGRKSTVATLTEIYHFLRLLFVKLGTQYCPDCDVPIDAQTAEAILARVMRDYRGRKIAVLAPLVTSRKGFYTDLAKWAFAKGFEFLRVDGEATPTLNWPRLARFKEHNIELPVGEITVTPKTERELRTLLTRALDFGKGVVQIAPLDGRKNDAKESVFSTKRACPSCGRGFPDLDPRLFSYNSKHGWCEGCYGTGLKMSGFDEQQTGEEIWWNAWWEDAEHECESCHGARLNPTALAVRFESHSIAELAALPVETAEKFFDSLGLRGRAHEIARDIVPEINARLRFLKQVGLGYLTLDRSAPTLSGGEAQRIRLAAQLGSNLRGVCYILDEPTIGLHHRDNLRLLDTLVQLERKGNTVVVVEHDEETIRRAQHVIDLGPGAGKRGGRVVAQGSAQALMREPESLTGRFLAAPLAHPLHPPRAVDKKTPSIDILGADLHNLKKVNATVPLGRLTVVTGVSGSGKSTLARDVLHANLVPLVRNGKKKKPRYHGCREIRGWEQIGRVLEVDQTPIGKTPRSCPATYVGFWDIIRRLYAEMPEARLRGYGPSRFSFNVSGGRCEACEGQGTKTIEMSFLPDVTVPCDVCHGHRFNVETLSVRYKDKSIGEVLNMNVDEAVEFFTAHSRIHHALRLLQDVGLGYLTLGQASPTLSGGEAQRIKLVTELAKVKLDGTEPPRGAANQTLYVLDEPTVGLHMADVEKLIRVLHRLVDAGNTVLVIEHDLDVIADADWIIDLGPEGGSGGGRVVSQSSPTDLIKRKDSHTAQALGEFLDGERVKPKTPATV